MENNQTPRPQRAPFYADAGLRRGQSVDARRRRQPITGLLELRGPISSGEAVTARQRGFTRDTRGPDGEVQSSELNPDQPR
ncbi:hypothetical protein AOLI_G00252080 [Acnodon oligacanthus]